MGILLNSVQNENLVRPVKGFEQWPSRETPY